MSVTAVMAMSGCGSNADSTAMAESTQVDSAGATGATTLSASTRRVVILGTSLTAGLGLNPEDAWPSLVQDKVDSAGLKLEIVNAGLSGETSAGALRRADWVLDRPAAAVILEVGANDGLRGVDPDSTHANLVELIQLVKKLQPAAKLFLVQMEAPPNLGSRYTSDFRSAYVRAAESESVVLLPFLLDGVAGVASLNQGDGIHPNESGSQRIANTMWNALLPSLREISR